MSLDYAYFVTLPHGAMGWPAVCDYALLAILYHYFKLQYLWMTTPLYYIRLNYISVLAKGN